MCVQNQTITKHNRRRTRKNRNNLEITEQSLNIAYARGGVASINLHYRGCNSVIDTSLIDHGID